MPSNTQQTLFEAFQAVSTIQEQNLARMLRSGDTIASSMERSAGLLQQLAVSQKPSSGTASTIGSIVSKVFTSGLGLIPLIGGLLGLFGGGEPEPPPLVKYAMPEQFYFQAADIGGGFSPADYNQMGAARPYGAGLAAGRAPGGAPGAQPSSAPSPIQVNVQAMDARSFLDHSSEIAQAVRQAMLNLNSLNDVVTEL